MVTPVILKVVFQIVLVLSNLVGLLMLAFYGVTGLLGIVALMTQDMGQAVMGLVILLVVLAVSVFGLVLWNVYLRVIFELTLLMFNMYDSLKAIEENTKGRK